MLDLDLDAFEGPFDLLLTLILKEELRLAEVEVADIVTSFAERLEDERRLDLEACGEFLVLVGAMLEIKARELFPDAAPDLADLSPEEAAEELAERLEAYRRMKSAAAWLSERLDAESDRYFRLGSGAARRRKPSCGSRRRTRTASPRPSDSSRPSRRRSRSPTCSSRFRRSRGSSSASVRCFAVAGDSHSTTRWPSCRGWSRRPRSSRSSSCASSTSFASSNRSHSGP